MNLRLITASTLVAVALTGCTGDGDDPSPSATPSLDAPAATASTSATPSPSPAAPPQTPGVAEVAPEGSVAQVIADNPNLETFGSLVEQFLEEPGRSGVFLQERGVTVLAPVNLPPDLVDAVRADDTLLTRFIGEHLLLGDIPLADLGASAAVVNGTNYQVVMDGDGVTTIGDQPVVEADVTGTNGRLHLLDNTLVSLSDLSGATDEPSPTASPTG